jgi:hypothetical protein
MDAMIGSDVPFQDDYARHSSLDNSMASGTPSQYSNVKDSIRNPERFNPIESFREKERSDSELKVLAL